jgi:Fe-S-cluster containining protein
MKTLSEKQALIKLRALKNELRASTKETYEHRAKDCFTCETPGACCLDAHFVNVHITRLEAVSMRVELAKLPPEKLHEIDRRITETIETFDLAGAGDTFAKTFACPLFEKGTGCTVHAVKPVPCIQHACYERPEDLPPDELQTEAERKIEQLNQQTYKKPANWLPLPVALQAKKIQD